MEKEGNEIVARFGGNRYVTKADLYRFYAEKEPDLKDTTLRWRIYRLKESKLLRPVSRGVYSVNTATEKLKFDPPATRRMDDLYGIYFTNFKMEPCALWSTEWIAQFLQHQPNHHFTVFEIEKELTHAMFFYTKMEGKEVFLNPDPEVVKNYVLSKKNPVVIKPLLSRAPLQKTRNGLPIASLEKILVDLFCDKDLFISYQGTELKNIFRNAWMNYELNLSTLMNYARRRRRGKQLLDFIKTSSIEMYNLLSK